MKTYIFNNDYEMYDKIDSLLKEGYKIKDGINHSIIMEGIEDILLTYQKIDINNPLESLKKINHKKDIIKPDFSNSILNVISAIRANYGYTHNSMPLDIFDKHYDNVIILLVDGLGVNVLNENLPKEAFLRKHYVKSISAIYPSTTAAATTSTICGKAPIETAWTGWENYFKEVNKDLILFNGIDYYNNTPTDFLPSSVIPFEPFYSDMKIKGTVIQPDFSKHPIDFDYVLNKSLELLNEYNIQYVYHPEPDGIMHKTGTYSKNTKIECVSINSKIEEYASKLKPNTLLIITADHGHTPVTPLFIHKNKQIMELLERKPSNDARCLAFKVKNENKEKFVKLFNYYYGDSYLLLNSKEAIKAGYFGPTNSIINPRSLEFLADFVAIGIGDYYFEYSNSDILFKSHHAGITKDEMEIPLILYKK